jgi:hypothetical protein
MPRKATMMKMLMVVAAAALAFQTAGAQGERPKRAGGAAVTASTGANGQDASVTKAIKAAADALGMDRWSQVGGGRLPEVDVINTMEFWASGTPYADYHVSLGYNPPAMRVEAARTATDAHSFQVVSGKYAWNESELGGGLIPGKGTSTPMPDAAKERALQLWILPFGVVKSALAAGDKAKVSTDNGATVLTFPMMGQLSGVTVKVTLDDKNFVTKVETQSDNPNLVMGADYSDYADRGEIPTNVMFPGHIVEKRGGKTLLDLQVKMADCNDPYLVFPVPDNVAGSSAAGN